MALPVGEPPINLNTQGAAGFGSYINFAGNCWLGFYAGVPTGGDGWAGPGSLIVDVTNFDIYMNTGTLATPTWTKKVD